jgi:hypothetical protein
MEVVTACENVCRDFQWMPIAAQVIGGLAAFGTMIIAWLAYANWRRPKVSERASLISADLLGDLRDFEITLLAARLPPSIRQDFDYVEAARLLRESGRIRAKMQPKAEVIAALIRRNEVARDVGSLLYVLGELHRSLDRAKEYAERGEGRLELQHRLIFIGEGTFGDDVQGDDRQMGKASRMVVENTIQRLRDNLCQFVRMEH